MKNQLTLYSKYQTALTNFDRRYPIEKDAPEG
jgi:hypothetical protein